jgi:hypothetical protein
MPKIGLIRSMWRSDTASDLDPIKFLKAQQLDTLQVYDVVAGNFVIIYELDINTT